MKKILVTGGCGFIGSSLVPKLIDEGMTVRVLDNFSSGSKHYLDGLDCDILEGDIRDESRIGQAVKGVDYVIHLAAFGSVIESIADPMENFDINVRGTLRLLKACVKQEVKRFIFASTGGALIGDVLPPVDEMSLPKPISPYGASKLCGETYCHAFAKSYDLQTVVLRFANVYGPNSAHKKGAVTAFLKAIMQGDPITIYGDGNASRDFLYVDDLCKGILLALNGECEAGEVFHLASGRETTISELARHLLKMAGKPNYPISFELARKGEVIRNFANYSKSKSRLGFRPSIPLEEGLRRTWIWFKDNKKYWVIEQAGQ